MKEVLLKFETEDLYNEFISKFVILQLQKQEVFNQQLDVKHLEWDQENNILIISNK
jgi:hypothetical protein